MTEREHQWTYRSDGRCKRCGKACLWFTNPNGKFVLVEDVRAIYPKGRLEKGDKISDDLADGIRENVHWDHCEKQESEEG